MLKLANEFRIIIKIGGKRDLEREHSFVRLCAQNTHKHSLFYAYSFYRRSYFIFGSLCTEFRWTIDTRRVVFRRFYLRLPIVNVRGRYYGWLGFSFGSESTQPSSSHFLSLSLLRLFFVIATRWKEEREEEEDVDDDEAPSARRLYIFFP